VSNPALADSSVELNVLIPLAVGLACDICLFSNRDLLHTTVMLKKT